MDVCLNGRNSNLVKKTRDFTDKILSISLIMNVKKEKKVFELYSLIILFFLLFSKRKRFLNLFYYYIVKLKT